MRRNRRSATATATAAAAGATAIAAAASPRMSRAAALESAPASTGWHEQPQNHILIVYLREDVPSGVCFALSAGHC